MTDGPSPATGPATSPWEDDTAGLVLLPTGRRVRGRGLRAAPPAGQPATVRLQLTFIPPSADAAAGTARVLWICWPDFGLPLRPARARDAFRAAYHLLRNERVEVACGGGVGRTGTGLACLAVLDGATPDEALALVRRTYHPRAVETPWQRAFVASLSSDG